jgi:hypothetical protein
MMGNTTRKEKQGSGQTILPVMIAVLAITAFAFIFVINYESNENDGSVIGAPGDHNTGDIAVINAIIDNNGLAWTKSPADGSSVDPSWTGMIWSAADTNKRITELNISSKKLTGTLDLSGLTSLTYLSCGYNSLTSLNISGLTALEQLNGNNIGDLISIDVSTNTALEFLDCQYNNLTSLDVSKNTALKTLFCGGNKMTYVDLSNNTALNTLHCQNGKLTSLDVSNNTVLTGLNCTGNDLVWVNVTGCPLKDLDCSWNYLSGKSKVIGFTGTWDEETFVLGPQYTEIPLIFVKIAAFDIPASTTGKAITNIDVSKEVYGGTGPYQFSATGLPDGLTINCDTGVISGTPAKATAAGTATITVHDSAGTQAAKSITISYSDVSEAGGSDSNMLLYILIIAVIALAAFAAYWFFIRPKT